MPSDAPPDIDAVLRALADMTRRQMVDRLTERPMSVSALAAPFDMTLTAVAQHLRVLEDCRLVRSEKLGRVRTYRIDPAGFDALAHWAKERRSIWERNLDALARHLAEDV